MSKEIKHQSFPDLGYSEAEVEALAFLASEERKNMIWRRDRRLDKIHDPYTKAELLAMFRPYLANTDHEGLSPREIRLLETIIDAWGRILDLESDQAIEEMLPPSGSAEKEYEFPFTQSHVYVENGAIYAVDGGAPLAKMIRDERATLAGIPPVERDANAQRFAYCWNKIRDMEMEEREEGDND